MRRFWLGTLAVFVVACGGASKSDGHGNDAAATGGLADAESNLGGAGFGFGGWSTSGSPALTAGTTSGAGAPGLGGMGGLADTSAGRASVGEGACAQTTLTDFIAAVHAAHPELSEINELDAATNDGQSEGISDVSTTDGFRVVFFRGFGDCPSGCIDREYFYFEADAQCEPVAAGDYHLFYSASGNCYRVAGAPLWGMPADSPTSTCEPVPSVTPGVNIGCLDGMCPVGESPTMFVPVAGPEMDCLCTIACADDPSICPPNTSCESAPELPPNICL